MSFAAWFFDFDNDGDLDLWSSTYSKNLPITKKDPYREPVAEVGPMMLQDGQDLGIAYCRLVRNNGDGTFTNVAKEMGLQRVVLVMGSNFGDLDNDGWLDLYLGDGNPSYRALLPNRGVPPRPRQVLPGRDDGDRARPPPEGPRHRVRRRRQRRRPGPLRRHGRLLPGGHVCERALRESGQREPLDHDAAARHADEPARDRDAPQGLDRDAVRPARRLPGGRRVEQLRLVERAAGDGTRRRDPHRRDQRLLAGQPHDAGLEGRAARPHRRPHRGRRDAARERDEAVPPEVGGRRLLPAQRGPTASADARTRRSLD